MSWMSTLRWSEVSCRFRGDIWIISWWIIGQNALQTSSGTWREHCQIRSVGLVIDVSLVHYTDDKVTDWVNDAGDERKCDNNRGWHCIVILIIMGHFGPMENLGNFTHFASFQIRHIVWKLPKMSHLNFSNLAFCTNFWPIKTDLSGISVWPQALGFQKIAKLDHFCHL